ncbi:unnamed protein product, partial [Nesidiocoris tenuis]
AYCLCLFLCNHDNVEPVFNHSEPCKRSLSQRDDYKTIIRNASASQTSDEARKGKASKRVRRFLVKLLNVHCRRAYCDSGTREQAKGPRARSWRESVSSGGSLVRTCRGRWSLVELVQPRPQLITIAAASSYRPKLQFRTVRSSGFYARVPHDTPGMYWCGIRTMSPA